jgi:hypothetical protein
MSDLSMDRLINQFAGVLAAMTESEALLLSRIRSVRQIERANGSFANFSNVSPPAVEDAGTTPVSKVAPATVASSSLASENFATPSARQPEPATPPEFPHTPASSVAGHRDYDYFADLDDKLVGLRQRYLE